jgi:hypothetical protein
VMRQSAGLAWKSDGYKLPREDGALPNKTNRSQSVPIAQAFAFVRQAHNLKVASSNLAPATNKQLLCS